MMTFGTIEAAKGARAKASHKKRLNGKRRPPGEAAGLVMKRASADEADAFLFPRLFLGGRLRRQLQHGGRLAFA